jgi:hypothetical protein
MFRFQRYADAAGIGFVVLFVVGVIVGFSAGPDIKKHDTPSDVARKIFHVYQSSGHRSAIIIGAYLMVLSAFALVWFASGLRARMAANDGDGPGRVVFGLAITGAAVIITSALALATVAGSFTFGNEPLPTNPDAIRVINDFGTAILLVGFGLAMAALVATVTVTDWHGDMLPKWLARAGILAILGGLLGVMFIPLVLVMAWFLAVAAIGLRRPVVAAAPDARSPVVEVR